MLRYVYACVFAILLSSSYSVLDHDGIDDDTADYPPYYNYAWTEADEEVEENNSYTDVFPWMLPNCLYFSVESIVFSVQDDGFNSTQLNEEYTDHSHMVTGCQKNSTTIHSEYHYGMHSNKTLFTFTATFQKHRKPNDCSEDSWSMVEFSHQNLTHENLTNSQHHFVYKTSVVTADNDSYFHCDKLSFDSVNKDATITLINVTIQAFFLDGNKLPSTMMTCRKSADYHYLTIVVNSGMGLSIILAIIVIIISCLTKRLKYGKYNLLDT